LLRNLRGANDEETRNIRKYLLGLTLIAATAEIDLFLREGCHLRHAGEDVWHAVPRRGDRVKVALASDAARNALVSYALEAVKPFREKWPKVFEYQFDLDEAKKLAKKGEEDPGEAAS
jgi:CRISPR-associated protein Csb1